MSYTLKQLAEKIGAKVHGDESYVIHSLATLSNANAQQIAFLANKKYSQQLSDTKAGAVIIASTSLTACNTNALVMDNPYLGYDHEPVGMKGCMMAACDLFGNLYLMHHPTPPLLVT